MIRDYQQEDFSDVIRVGRVLHAESQYKDIEFCEDTASVYMDYASREGFFKVVVVDGEIVGFGAANLITFFFSKAPIASDVSFYIVPEHRKGGGGARLYIEYIKWAKAKGCIEVQVAGSYGFESNEHGNLKRLLECLDFKAQGEFFKRKL